MGSGSGAAVMRIGAGFGLGCCWVSARVTAAVGCVLLSAAWKKARWAATRACAAASVPARPTPGDWEPPEETGGKAKFDPNSECARRTPALRIYG